MASRGRGGGGPSRGGMRKPYVVTTKLYIGNIPETCRKMDLQKLFEAHGKVVECDIVKNYGFVVSACFYSYQNTSLTIPTFCFVKLLSL